jgi:C-terminal domain of 1-Cys peroxiredoxin
VFVISPDKTIKLIIAYPNVTGRNFTELLRVIDSLQLTARHRVVTPANWNQGDDVMIHNPVSDDQARVIFGEWTSVKPYIRSTREGPCTGSTVTSRRLRGVTSGPWNWPSLSTLGRGSRTGRPGPLRPGRRPRHPGRSPPAACTGDIPADRRSRGRGPTRRTRRPHRPATRTVSHGIAPAHRRPDGPATRRRSDRLGSGSGELRTPFSAEDSAP